jgi:diacylglycerol kinase
LAKKTKDMSAAAVLLISFGAFICGIIIFIPKIYTLLAYA